MPDLVEISRAEVIEVAKKYVAAKVALREPCAPTLAKHPAVEPYLVAEEELFAAVTLLEERERIAEALKVDL